MSRIPIQWRAQVKSELSAFIRSAEEALQAQGLKVLSRLQFTASKPTVVLVLGLSRVRGSAVIQHAGTTSAGDTLEVQASRATPARAPRPMPGYGESVEAFERALEAYFQSIAEPVQLVTRSPNAA